MFHRRHLLKYAGTSAIQLFKLCGILIFLCWELQQHVHQLKASKVIILSVYLKIKCVELDVKYLKFLGTKLCFYLVFGSKQFLILSNMYLVTDCVKGKTVVISFSGE
jgi:hypothetical protein